MGEELHYPLQVDIIGNARDRRIGGMQVQSP